MKARRNHNSSQKVSHELRTPLSGIVASAQLISAEAMDARLVKRADIILRLSNDLLLEINDLLDSAKIRSQRSHPCVDAVRSTRCHGTYSVHLRIDGRSQEHQFYRDGGPRHQEHGARRCALLKSGIEKNLAGNAVKFTDVGKVEINLQLLEKDR
ncbi:histidine kinase dimerization/phospho-acceptor domain-containing protein [Undibacterium arcticum]